MKFKVVITEKSMNVYLEAVTDAERSMIGLFPLGNVRTSIDHDGHSSHKKVKGITFNLTPPPATYVPISIEALDVLYQFINEQPKRKYRIAIAKIYNQLVQGISSSSGYRPSTFYIEKND